MEWLALVITGGAWGVAWVEWRRAERRARALAREREAVLQELNKIRERQEERRRVA